MIYQRLREQSQRIFSVSAISTKFTFSVVSVGNAPKYVCYYISPFEGLPNYSRNVRTSIVIMNNTRAKSGFSGKPTHTTLNCMILEEIINFLHHCPFAERNQIIGCWPRMFHRNVNNSQTREEGDANLMLDAAPGE